MSSNIFNVIHILTCDICRDAVLTCHDRRSLAPSSLVPDSTLLSYSPNRLNTLHLDAVSSVASRTDDEAVSLSVGRSGYYGDRSSVGRSPDPSTACSDRMTTRTTSTSRSSARPSSGENVASLLSPTSPGSYAITSSTASNSPNPSVGYECRTDTSALSPRPSLVSPTQTEMSTYPKSPTPSRTSSHLGSTLPALPTPPLPSPKRFTLHDPPVSPSAAATPTKAALLRTPTSSRAQSPSIMNLSQVSMVKQRLAEIERTNTLSSRATSTPRSTRSRQYSPLPQSPLSPTSTQKSRSRMPLRVNTEAVSEEEAIINSYADSAYGGGSPLSAFAGRSARLTSVPSRQNTTRSRLTETTVKSDAVRPPANAKEIGSPASAYSAAFLSPLPTPERMPFSNVREVIDTREVRASSVSTSRHADDTHASTHIPQPPLLPQKSPLLQFEDCPPRGEPPVPMLKLTRMNRPGALQKTPPLRFEDVPSKRTSGPLIFQSMLDAEQSVNPPSPSVHKVRDERRSPALSVTTQQKRQSIGTPAELSPADRSPVARYATPVKDLSPKPAQSFGAYKASPSPRNLSLLTTQSAFPSRSPPIVSEPEDELLTPTQAPITHYENLPSRRTPPSRVAASSDASRSPVPPLAQKTPLMLALESPRSYAPPRGPQRPARLTKPALLSPAAPAIQQYQGIPPPVPQQPQQPQQ